jgi:hypothetical protein
MANSSVPITAGTGTNIDTFAVTGGDHRQIVMIGDHGGYKGRVSTFRMLGRAAASHKLFSIHNATGSSVVVDVRKITVDIIKTAASATLTDYGICRLWKVTALPTGGTAATKVAEDSGSGSSNASVTVLQDASADGTNSGTPLAATLPAGTIASQEACGRLFTGAGYEMADRMEFLTGQDEQITLRALEGLVVTIEGTTGYDNANTFYIVTCRWEEYTP